MSEQTPGIIPGNDILVLKQRKHNIFTRKGNDLEATLHISLKEALLGFKHEITHLDGHKVIIERNGDKSTIPGQVIKMKKEGMPIHNFPSDRGNLYVKIVVDFPTTLSDKQKEGISNSLN